MMNRKHSKKTMKIEDINYSNNFENNKYYFNALIKFSDAIKYGFFDNIEYGKFRNLDEDYELNWLVIFIESDNEDHYNSLWKLNDILVKKDYPNFSLNDIKINHIFKKNSLFSYKVNCWLKGNTNNYTFNYKKFIDNFNIVIIICLILKHIISSYYYET